MAPGAPTYPTTLRDAAHPGTNVPVPQCSHTQSGEHRFRYRSGVTAIFSLFIVIALSLVVTRVATVALTATGLSREAARFQARSAFSGAGFTTTESESVVSHPVRRRIIMWLMLAGNAGIAAAMATLVLAAVDTSDTHALIRVAAVVGGIFLMWWASRLSWVDRRISRLAAIGLRRWTKLDVHDYAALLHVGGEYIVTEVPVESGSWLADRSLAELSLRDEGVILLGIERADGSYLGVPQGDTVLVAGDVAILYSRSETLAGLDHRQRDASGEAAHEAAVADQQRVVEQEQASDPDTSG